MSTFMFWRRRCDHNREREREASALPWTGVLEPHSPGMRLDKPSHDGQTQPGAASSSILSVDGTNKAFEYVIALVGRDAGPVVDNPDHDSGPFTGDSLDAEWCPRRGLPGGRCRARV